MKNIEIHSSAQVSENAEIGDDTKIWNNAQIRENAKIGNSCVIGKNVYIDRGVRVGNNVKIQNNVSIFYGVEIEDGVFVGPHVCFTNDKLPRSITPDGSLKKSGDWKISKTLVKYGASIGANSTILSNITIGKWAMVGAGAVVTKNVPDYGIVVGNPAHLIGYANEKGEKVKEVERGT
ncbi:MAG: N-acetyltransferase [Candidatus Aenigmarchaeota archaeon]|nr:N-acetyltransferase [Candidatus Aenigmarchaeota archaeon]